RRLRGELYPLIRRWGETPLALVDRRAAPLLGIRCFGLHVNGTVERADGLHIWVGRRAEDKAIAPGEYDHLVAGGQPAGLSLADNLVKEAAEEANLPEELARRAKPVGAVTYRCDWPGGCKDDVLFCYDLEVPEDFTPENTDGEVAHFELWPVERVIAELRETDSFKFNVAPVVIDFLIRRGILTPENEPDYLRLAASLRTAPPD
ncbi:MAG: NUDIX domain-containing protein, partial [Rhodovibrionaceae bacterium]